jgi:filamentous hemagglutinin family protein
MNKNRFRRVFSKRHGMLVAVAEDVSSQGKAPGEGASAGVALAPELGVVSSLTAFAMALFVMNPAGALAQALPTGGQVTAGQAAISQNGNTMNINQGTQRTVIDWNSFNIGKGNTVQFNQPNAQAQALNRVTGAGASTIQGALLANGQVLIQNANGILFSKGSVVNVGSLLATTKSIDSNAFMAGNPLQLSSTGKNASVVNDGTIQAQGYVTLMGDQARNTGSITTAPGGQVVLAAGDSATVALANGQGVQLTLNNATANALVENSGTIKAENGSVLLTARGNDTLLKMVVNLSGIVRAGTVVADAGKTGDVAVTGKIDASNNAPGGTGGTVVLSGDRVGVLGSGSIDASGDAAGGKVILGGDSLNQLAGTQAAGMLQDGVNLASFTQVQGANTDLNGGALTITGNSVNGDGLAGVNAVWLAGNITNVSGGSITGAANTGAGVTFAGNFTEISGSALSVAGSSETGVGLTQQAGSTLNIVGNGSVDLSGVTSNGSGVFFAGNTNLNQSASLNATSHAGAYVLGTDNLSGNAQLNVNGVSGTSVGVATDAAITATDNSNITMTGSGGGSENGFELRGPLNTTGNANVSLTGTSVGGAGLSQTGTSNGTININGDTNSGDGVIINGDVNSDGNGGINIDGNSTGDGNGVVIDGNVVANGDSTINIDGGANNGSGVVIDGNTDTHDNGTININGDTNSGDGVIINGDVNSDGNGGINIDGNSTGDGNGVVIDGNVVAMVFNLGLYQRVPVATGHQLQFGVFTDVAWGRVNHSPWDGWQNTYPAGVDVKNIRTLAGYGAGVDWLTPFGAVVSASVAKPYGFSSASWIDPGSKKPQVWLSVTWGH